MTGSDQSVPEAGDGKHSAQTALWQCLAPGEVVAMLDRLTDVIVVLGADWRWPCASSGPRSSWIITHRLGVQFVQGYHLGRPAPSIHPRRETVAY
jgi:hypothetical protein